MTSNTIRHIGLAFIAVLLLLFPTSFVRHLARLGGHRIAPGARIGFSLVLSRRIYLDSQTRIGHLNIIRNDRLLLRKGAYIGHLNTIHGPVGILLAKRAAIGNRNVVSRAARGVTYGAAVFRLGELSKITASHSIDCTVSVTFGEFSTLAGKGSQIWTHGYVHAMEGAERYRVDGRVCLGRNVYVGSRAIITGGVNISDGIMVGVGTVVSKSISKPGMYVSSAIRYLPKPGDPRARADMEPVTAPGLVETVYRKRDPCA